MWVLHSKPPTIGEICRLYCIFILFYYFYNLDIFITLFYIHHTLINLFYTFKNILKSNFLLDTSLHLKNNNTQNKYRCGACPVCMHQSDLNNMGCWLLQLAGEWCCGLISTQDTEQFPLIGNVYYTFGHTISKQCGIYKIIWANEVYHRNS